MSVKQEATETVRTTLVDSHTSVSDAAKLSNDNFPNIAALEDSEAQESEFQFLKRLVNDLSKQCELLKVPERRGEQWRATAARLSSEVLPDTHIGLFGATGSGKSSLLNCLLDRDILEKRGNGDACTAFVSRVVWNDDPITHGRVTFVSLEVWKAEVETFLNVLYDGVANAMEDSISYAKKEESQIWAKLDAVYPSLCGALRPDITVEDILSLDRGLKNCFGKTLDYYGEDADDLTDNLRAVVRRASQMDTDDELVEADDPQPSSWPLVAEVEYHVDADILRGVVLVDLPGVQDSNAARDQIALKYLGRLDHVFVVAGAVRASDSNPFAGNLAPGIRQILMGEDVYYLSSYRIFSVTWPVDHRCKWLQRYPSTQGDVCLLPTKTSVNDAGDARLMKDEFWEIARKINECDKLRRQLETQIKHNASAPQKGKKRPRSPTDGGGSVGKRRQNISSASLGSARAGGRRSAFPTNPGGTPTNTPTGDNFKDLHVHLKRQTDELESLRARQEVLRPSLLRLAAIERRQNIQSKWPRRFVDAVSTHMGEAGNQALPAVFCTSAETYRRQQHGTTPLSDCDSDAGISSLQQHVQQLGRNRRNWFLKLFIRDIRSHALTVEDYLRVTGEKATGSDEEMERDAGIARFMLRWYSASFHEVRKDDHGIFSTAFQVLESVCEQLESEMVDILSHAFIGSLRAAPHTASGTSLQTFNELASLVKWNTLLAYVRRDGVFHTDWNASMIAPMKDDILGVWTQTFKQLDLSQEGHERVQDLHDEVATILGQIRESAAQDEARALFAPRVDEFTAQAALNTESAIQAALDAAQAKLTLGQRNISRGMADKLQTELFSAYASARDAEPGIGVALRTKSNFREKIQQDGSRAFENVAEKTIDGVRTLLREVCADLRAALFRCAIAMESDISVLWARVEGGGTGDSELFLRRVAHEVTVQILDHVAKSPFYEPLP
ncbi:hypothetical protein PENSPDRAFT_684640 [Peniophora sp. CONT]|nr:hypothetical protein PENSPDRAFT_684640 [Peniophora sp. CONT]